MIRINQSEEESKLSDPNEQYEFDSAAKEEKTLQKQQSIHVFNLLNVQYCFFGRNLVSDVYGGIPCAYMLVAQLSCFLMNLSEFCYRSSDISFYFGNILSVDVGRTFHRLEKVLSLFWVGYFDSELS